MLFVRGQLEWVLNPDAWEFSCLEKVRYRRSGVNDRLSDIDSASHERVCVECTRVDRNIGAGDREEVGSSLGLLVRLQKQRVAWGGLTEISVVTSLSELFEGSTLAIQYMSIASRVY